MRRLALIAVALLALAPAAQGKRPHRHRGTVKADFGRAPARWRVLSTWVTAPAATPAATPTPAPVATPAATATPVSALPPPSTRSVSVSATEFAFTLSQATVDAGEVRVVFDNTRAEDPHQLTVDGPDPDFWTFPELGPGETSRQTLTLRPGRHLLVCPLPGHEELGMRTVLTVR